MALSTPFITDADLQEFMPDILNFGIATFAQQNLRASDDVYERVMNEWWPQAVTARYGLARETTDIHYPTLPKLDLNYLDIAALKPMTVYRAISHYIMPMLASDADANGDLFSRREARYDKYYIDEWNKVKRLPLYDFNKDNQFSNAERVHSVARRLVRA